MQDPGILALRWIEDGRDDLDMLNGCGDAQVLVVAGHLDHQRDVRRFLVEEHSVFLFTVIAESFSMVRQEQDGRPIVESRCGRRPSKRPTSSSA